MKVNHRASQEAHEVAASLRRARAEAKAKGVSPTVYEPLVDRMMKAMQRSQTGREDGWAYQSSAAHAALEAMLEPGLAIRKAVSFETAEVTWPRLIRAALAEPSMLDDPMEDEDDA